MGKNGFIDSKSKRIRGTGLNIEPVEKFLIKHKGFGGKPIGLALKQEYGKKISMMEFIHKAEWGKDKVFESGSLGLASNLMKVNRRINQQIKKEAHKHLQ